MSNISQLVYCHREDGKLSSVFLLLFLHVKYFQAMCCGRKNTLTEIITCCISRYSQQEKQNFRNLTIGSIKYLPIFYLKYFISKLYIYIHIYTYIYIHIYIYIYKQDIYFLTRYISVSSKPSKTQQEITLMLKCDFNKFALELF